MKKIWLILLLTAPSWGAVITYRVDTGSTSIPATFPTSPQIAGLTQVTAIQIDNQSNAELEVNCNYAAKPPINNGNGIYIATTNTFSTPSPVSMGPSCFIRAYTGTASSGILRVTAWGW